MYEINDQVFINFPRSLDHGKSATIIAINPAHTNPYQAQIDGDDFAFWYTAGQLSTEPIRARAQAPQTIAKPTESPYDFDRTGAGIGGIGRFQDDPIIPTQKAFERYEQLRARATYCRRCHQSDVFDGAMFTTDPASGLCDDCL